MLKKSQKLTSRPDIKPAPSLSLPRGSIVVPFDGSYLESYKVIPKKNYYGAHGEPMGKAQTPKAVLKDGGLYFGSR